MPVRTIPKNYRNLTGIVASSKSQEEGQFESTLERDFLYLLDFDINVDSFNVQPAKIPYIDSEEVKRTYTPDVLVRYRDDINPAKNWQPKLFEVKYRSDLFEQWKLLKPKFKSARKLAHENGWSFHIITEKEIRTPYLKNVKFLRYYKNNEVDASSQLEILKAMYELRQTTPNALFTYLKVTEWEQACALPILWRLIGMKRIGVDLMQPLNMESIIWSQDSVQEYPKNAK
jgi:hypothetical protein